MTEIETTPLAVVTGASSGIGFVQPVQADLSRYDGKVLPDELKAAAHRQMAEPGSGD